MTTERPVMRIIQPFWALAVCICLAAVLLIPAQALSGGPSVYYAKHATLLYFDERDFMRFEAAFRDGVLGEKHGYGPASEFLAGRLDGMYRVLAAGLGVKPYGPRATVVLLDGRGNADDLFNRRGLEVAEGPAMYDGRSGAVFVMAAEAGACEVAGALAEFIAHAGLGVPAGDAARMVSAQAAADACEDFGGTLAGQY